MLQVREHTYRGRDGWLICGKPKDSNRHRGVTIFADQSREQAEAIRDRLKAEGIGVDIHDLLVEWDGDSDG